MQKRVESEGKRREAKEATASVVKLSMVFLLFICSAYLFAHEMGTLFPGIPYYGSVASYTTVGQMHVVILAAGFIFLMSGFLLAVILTDGESEKWERWPAVINFIFSGIVMGMCLFVTVSVMGAVREAGADASLARSFKIDPEKDIEMQTVTYSSYDGHALKMDIYSSPTDTSAKKPVAVFIHGGGWIYGSRKNHSYYARRFAENGFVAVNVDYSLSTYKKHMAGEEKKSKDENGSVVVSVIGTTAEKELARSLAYLSYHAEDLCIDEERIFLYGDSAGGNLALDLGFKIASGHYRTAKIKEDGKSQRVPLPEICAISVEYPVADPVGFWENPDKYFQGSARRMVYSYTGGSPWKKGAVYDSITPGEFVTEDAPPTLLVVGEGDHLVPPEATYELADTFDYLGVDNKLVKIPFANHAFDKIDGSYLSQAYFDLTLQWFEDTGTVPLSP